MTRQDLPGRVYDRIEVKFRPLDCQKCGRIWPAPCTCRMAPSQGQGPGRHTKLWLELSWCLGDEHAHRICKIIDWYVKVFRLRGRSWH